MFTIKNCKDPVSAARLINRLQVMHKRVKGAWKWTVYNDLYSTSVWITSQYRVIGLGRAMPNPTLLEGELLISIPLPWKGTGSVLSEHVNTSVNRANNRLRRQGISAADQTYVVGPQLITV